jgi:lipoate-protein ligase A
MFHFDCSLPSPAENLAADEALWESCEAGGPEVLRFWESPEPFVVVGYGNRVATEVDVAACRERRVPVLRRITGGGTVVQGPGCLNYSLVLRTDHHAETAGITQTNRWIMHRNATALTSLLGRPVRRRGDTDLALGEHKFSGNAQRRGRHAILFHGSLLLNLDLALVSTLLPRPSREPDYRRGREHADFVVNLGEPPTRVKAALIAAWHAEIALPDWPRERTATLAAGKYGTPEWNLRF